MDIKLKNYFLFSVPVDFEISKIHIPYSRHIIIELFINGKYGIGEGVSYKSALSQIEKYIDNDDINFEPGLMAAYDQAILDSQGVFNNITTPNYTKQVFIDTPRIMIEKIDSLTALGCREIKLKLGRNIKNDIFLVNRFKTKYPKIKFKADVNCGYTVPEFRQVIAQTGNFIQVWEEPVAKKYLPDIVKLKNKYHLKIMLDENVKTIDDLNLYIRNGVIDILNIKLSRLGGITAAHKYVKMCQENKIMISIGCSEELGVGMKAINHLASQVNHVFGVEGEGSERLSFNILDKENNFDLGELEKAAQRFNFKIFTRENKMKDLDKIYEYKDNIYAKYRNLLVKLCR